jgi:hypothetical protein
LVPARADAAARGVGFDERFPLYFEEIDFLRRLRGKIVYLPAARCRHIYNQSAAGSSDAAVLYARSELEYLAKWNGRRFARYVKQLERPLHAGGAQPLEGNTMVIDRPDVVVEASPLPSFETAAGHFATAAQVSIPPEVLDSYRSKVLYLRLIDRHSAAILATYAKARIGA